MTLNQLANELLNSFKNRYRVVDKNGKTVIVVNSREQAEAYTAAVNGDYIKIAEK